MKSLSPEEAVSDVVSHVIILGITVIGVGMITLYGVPEILELQDMANLKNIEQTFTMLDSQASRAVLGGSPLQITNVNLGGGALMVEPNSSTSKSYITIKGDNFNVTIPMGKIKYQLGDRIIAYEGGGLWSKYPSGSVMLSPPKFHYNGITLVLPVISINGNASAGGKGTAVVSFKKNATVVQYPNKSFANRTNPINYNTAGKVYVNITSEFYDAWFNYARTLSYAKNVKRNSTTRTTSVELTVAPVTLERNSSIVNPIGFRWLDPGDATPLENFSFRLIAPLKNWDILHVTSGNKKLIYYIRGTADSVGDRVRLYVGYQNGNGSNTAEIWKGTRNLTVQQQGGTLFMDVNLLNTSYNLNYTDGESVGSDDSSCTPFGGRINENYFNNTDFSWDNIVIQKTPPLNNTQSLYNITQHYIWKMTQYGDIYFNQCGEDTPLTGSSMLINYTGNLSYLHITENRADVGIS